MMISRKTTAITTAITTPTTALLLLVVLVVSFSPANATTTELTSVNDSSSATTTATLLQQQEDTFSYDIPAASNGNETKPTKVEAAVHYDSSNVHGNLRTRRSDNNQAYMQESTTDAGIRHVAQGRLRLQAFPTSTAASTTIFKKKNTNFPRGLSAQSVDDHEVPASLSQTGRSQQQQQHQRRAMVSIRDYECDENGNVDLSGAYASWVADRFVKVPCSEFRDASRTDHNNLDRSSLQPWDQQYANQQQYCRCPDQFTPNLFILQENMVATFPGGDKKGKKKKGKGIPTGIECMNPEECYQGACMVEGLTPEEAAIKNKLVCACRVSEYANGSPSTWCDTEPPNSPDISSSTMFAAPVMCPRTWIEAPQPVIPIANYDPCQSYTN